MNNVPVKPKFEYIHFIEVAGVTFIWDIVERKYKEYIGSKEEKLLYRG